MAKFLLISNAKNLLKKYQLIDKKRAIKINRPIRNCCIRLLFCRDNRVHPRNNFVKIYRQTVSQNDRFNVIRENANFAVGTQLLKPAVFGFVIKKIGNTDF